MKKIHIIYSPLTDEHFAVCTHMHGSICPDSSRANTLEELSVVLHGLDEDHKRRVEFVIDHTMPSYYKRRVKDLVRKSFRKSYCTEDLSGKS